MEISRETYRGLPIDNKMDVVFDLLVENKQDHEVIKTDIVKCNIGINKRKKIETTTAGLMGFVGGLVGFFSQKIFFK